MTLEWESEIIYADQMVGGDETIVFFQTHPEYFDKGDRKYWNYPWSIVFANKNVNAKAEDFQRGDIVKITIERVARKANTFPPNVID